MYHQPRTRVKKNIHRVSTAPVNVYVHVGPCLFDVETFRNWERVLELGFEGHSLARVQRNIWAIGSRQVTWGQA